MNNPFTTENQESDSTTKFPSWKFIIIALMVSAAISILIWAYAVPSQQKTVDDKLSQIKELRSEKKTKEQQVEELKKAIYVLDQKIIPLKCSVYSEVWAKDTWESECRDSHEEQKQKILNQESEQVDEAVVPEYQ